MTSKYAKQNKHDFHLFIFFRWLKNTCNYGPSPYLISLSTHNYKGSDHILFIIILRLGSQELVGKEVDEFNFKHTECELLMGYPSKDVKLIIPCLKLLSWSRDCSHLRGPCWLRVPTVQTKRMLIGWQMVWEVRQSTLCCGCVPFACPASFALCAGTRTPLGGAEPIHVVKSADPPQRTPIPPRSVSGRKLDLQSRFRPLWNLVSQKRLSPWSLN